MPAPEHQDDHGPASADEDLERRLASLIPAAPRGGTQRRLGRELENLAETRSENRQIWMRFAPLAAAACVMLAGAWMVQRQLAGDHAQTETEAEVATVDAKPEASAAEPEPEPGTVFVSPPPISSGIPADRFVPVSTQEILRQASPGGVVELSDEVSARELRLQYDQAWHWRDPKTRTNVRIFRPHEEILLVPIETD